MRAAGVDGCRAGWIAVLREPDGGLRSVVLASAEEIAALDPTPDAVAIDIPIGLPDLGPRLCDKLARSLLGGRRSSVFTAPLRPVLGARDWGDACAIRFRLEGKRMTKQAWGIVPKIRDVDSMLRARPGQRERLREFHPELTFREWAGRPMPHAKKSAAGRAARLELVARHFGADAFQQVRMRYTRSAVVDDDILDAFAGLWTAERIVAGEAERLPADPPIDSAGLPMEMLF